MHKASLPDTREIHSRSNMPVSDARRRISAIDRNLASSPIGDFFMSDNTPPQVTSRRRFIGVAAATLAAGSLSQLAFAETDHAITHVTEPAGSDKTAIRSLRVHV